MMKLRILLLTLVCCILSLNLAGSAAAANEPQKEGQQVAPFFTQALCLPNAYAAQPENCLALGASQSVSRLVEMGFAYPPREIPAAAPDSSLSVIPALIARINVDNTEPAYIYASFEEAVEAANPIRSIAPGTLRYVSYVTRADHEGKAYLQLASGEWLRASPVAYTRFQGLQFSANPRNDFGWIVDETPSYTAPSFAAAKTGKTYYREHRIQIYDTQEAESVYWYLIGPDEWVNSLKSRRAQFDPTPPEGVDNQRWISLNLFEQTLLIYENGRLLFATLMSSGLEPFYTQPGLFKIYNALPFETMQGAFEADRSDYYYLQDVPWTLYFDQARAIHGSYWRTYFGYPQSHGCINLSPGDANWVFQWAKEGDWVHVYDPSGRTPTDPTYYGPGAP